MDRAKGVKPHQEGNSGAYAPLVRIVSISRLHFCGGGNGVCRWGFEDINFTHPPIQCFHTVNPRCARTANQTSWEFGARASGARGGHFWTPSRASDPTPEVECRIVARTRHYSSKWRVRATLYAISENIDSGAYAPLFSAEWQKEWRVRATINVFRSEVQSGAYAPVFSWKL